MKSAGMDANRVMINYIMTSVLRVFLLLILLGRPTLVLTQDTTGPTATIKILPEYTTEPREGDSVTLECEISSNQQPDSVLWSRRNSLQEPQIIIADETGITTLVDNRFSVSPLQVVNSTAALYSHKLTIDPLRQSDHGFYQCFVNTLLSSGDYQTVATSSVTTFLVHRRDEFPVCFSDGPATVTIGSSLSCKTLLDTRIPIVSEVGMPNVSNDGWETSPTNGGGSPGQELIKTVTDSEHGKTFQCFSTSDVSDISPACKIGPLTVIFETTTPSPVNETTVNTTTIFTVTDNQKSAGLSGADIAGIVVGVVLLLIIIAVHTLCCRCNPKRWLHAKSYPFARGSSYEASRKQSNTVRTEPEVELGNSEPQTNKLYSVSQAPTENDTGTITHGSGTIENLQPVPTPEPRTSEEPDLLPTYPKPKLKPKPPAMYAQVNKTTPETDTKGSTEPPAVYAQVNKTTPTDTMEPPGPKPPTIYPKVTQPTPKTDTSEPINPQPNPAEINTQMDEKAPQDDDELLKENGKGSSRPQKNIKSFGQNRKGQVARPPKPEPVIIYADLNLQKTGDDEARRPPSDDSQTVYAEIRH